MYLSVLIQVLSLPMSRPGRPAGIGGDDSRPPSTGDPLASRVCLMRGSQDHYGVIAHVFFRLRAVKSPRRIADHNRSQAGAFPSPCPLPEDEGGWSEQQLWSAMEPILIVTRFNLDFQLPRLGCISAAD